MIRIAIVLLVSVLPCLAHPALRARALKTPVVASGSAPTFIAEYELAWASSTTPKTTAAFDAVAGDVLLVCLVKEDNSGTPGTPTGGTLTYGLLESITAANRCEMFIWAATVDVNKNMTVTVTDNGGGAFAANILHWRGTSGTGAAESASAADGTAQIAITTTAANSAVVVFIGDFEAADGASRMWVTTAGALTEVTYHLATAQYTIYGGYHANVGAAAAKTVGLSAPTGLDYSIAAIEVKP